MRDDVRRTGGELCEEERKTHLGGRGESETNRKTERGEEIERQSF